MKELYIAPELNVICFAPVERLANNDLLETELMLDISVRGGQEDGASIGDDDFGLDII